jgi:hypothetical protein
MALIATRHGRNEAGMRAEIETLVEQIQQAIDLLRRHL